MMDWVRIEVVLAAVDAFVCGEKVVRAVWSQYTHSVLRSWNVFIPHVNLEVVVEGGNN